MVYFLKRNQHVNWRYMWIGIMLLLHLYRIWFFYNLFRIILVQVLTNANSIFAWTFVAFVLISNDYN